MTITNNQHEVDCIVTTKTINNQKYYQVGWKGGLSQWGKAIYLLM